MAMTDAELRARVRELIASGDLPSEQPIVQNSGPGFGSFKRGSSCLICGEPGTMVAYFWTGGPHGERPCGVRRDLEAGKNQRHYEIAGLAGIWDVRWLDSRHG